MHKNITTAIILVSLIGCVPVAQEYYLPTNKDFIYEGFVCGRVPYGGYHYSFSDRAAISISVGPKDNDLYITIQYLLNGDGSYLKMASNLIYIKEPNKDKRIIDVTHIYDDFPSINPTNKIEKRDIYDIKLSSFKIENYLPSKFTLTLPKFVVNDSDREIPPIEFVRVRKKGGMTCVQ